MKGVVFGLVIVMVFVGSAVGLGAVCRIFWELFKYGWGVK